MDQKITESHLPGQYLDIALLPRQYLDIPLVAGQYKIYKINYIAFDLPTQSVIITYKCYVTRHEKPDVIISTQHTPTYA